MVGLSRLCKIRLGRAFGRSFARLFVLLCDRHMRLRFYCFFIFLFMYAYNLVVHN